MTQILFDLKETSPQGDVPIDAQINCYPVARRKDGTVLVTRRGFTVRTGFKPVVIDLHQTNLDGAWLITISSHNNDIVHGFYAVPAPEMVDGVEVPKPFNDLLMVDPDTLEPSEDPDPIWWAMARNTVTDGTVDGNGDLILTHHDGKTTNAGRVKGDRGERGLRGLPGRDGTNGLNGADGLNDVGVANLIQTPTSETSTALSAAIGFIPGVVADDATDNRAAIQAAVDQGGRWMLPPTAGRYAVVGSIDLTVAGTQLYAWGAPLRQVTNGETMFRAIAPDLLLDGLDGIGAPGEPSFAGLTESWEGSITASRWCVVNIYATAHRLRIPWVRGRGMSAVVRSGGWDIALAAEAPYHVDDIEIGTVLCDKVEFGVALKGTRRIKIGDVRGTYGNTATLPRPPHLIYFAPSGAGGAFHVDPTVLSGSATDGKNGHAFQIKGVTGGTFGQLQARSCAGVLNCMDVADVEISELISWADTYAASQGGAVTFDKTTATTGVNIGRARIDMASNGKPFYIINGDHITVDTLHVTVNHTTLGGGDDLDVTVGGHHNEIRDLSVVNTGPRGWRAAGVWGLGEGNRIHAREIINARIGLDGRTSQDAVLHYDADRITLHPTDGLYKLGGTGGAKFIAPQTAVLRDRAVVADTFQVGSDSFGTVVATITGHLWDKSLGDWRSGTDGARTAASIGGARMFVDTGITSRRVECDIQHANSTDSLVISATADKTQHLWAALTNTALTLHDEAATVLATVAMTFAPGRTYRVGATIFGDGVDIYIDGVKMLSHTLTAGQATTYNTAPLSGVRTNSMDTRFRNLKATAL